MSRQVARGQRRGATGKTFFPELISGPFHNGLVTVFTAAVATTTIAALASLLRGRRQPIPLA